MVQVVNATEVIRQDTIEDICNEIRVAKGKYDITGILETTMIRYQIKDDDFTQVLNFAADYKGKEKMKNQDYIDHKEEVIKKAKPYLDKYVF